MFPATPPPEDLQHERWVRDRAADLHAERMQATRARTDRLFARLMGLQWAAGLCAALLLSPRTWAGAESRVHPHVWVALGVGGLVASLPALLARRAPGEAVTRHTIAVAQALFSGLLVHLSGGRIETHFHIFGSLAFLAFYKDHRVLLSYSAVVALDHLVRGWFYPLSIYGVLAGAE